MVSQTTNSTTVCSAAYSSNENQNKTIKMRINWCMTGGLHSQNANTWESVPMTRRLYLTHWGRVTHICVSKLSTLGSDNGLSPDLRQAIIWTNAGILLIGPLGTSFSEIEIEIHAFSLKKMHLKMSYGNGGHLSRPQCVKWLIRHRVMSNISITLVCLVVLFRSAFSTILTGSISYLHILSSNFRGVSPVDFFFNSNSIIWSFGKLFKFVTLILSCFDLDMTCSTVWVIMGQRGYPQNACVLVVLVIFWYSWSATYQKK